MFRQWFGFILVLALAGVASAANTGNVIDIKLGQSLSPSWPALGTANYAYIGWRQTYDSSTHATTVYLPYGNTDGVYYAVSNIGWKGGGASDPLKVFNVGTSDSKLAYKLHFDAPIQSFSIFMGWTEYALQGKTGNCGILYSTNGVTWHDVKTISGPAPDTIAEPFANDVSVSGIDTRDLYIAFVATDTTTDAGITRYMSWRAVGAGNWGEKQFWRNVPHLTVTPLSNPRH